MRPSPRFFASVVALLLSVVAGRAGELAPLMTEPGRLLVNDAFVENQPPPGWNVSKKGHMEFGGGQIKGTEIKENNHPALVRHDVPVRDLIVAFSVRLADASQMSLSIDDAQAHVCRVIVDPKGFTLQKDDRDRTGPDKAAALKRVALPIGNDGWHQVLVEIRGAELVVQVDDRSHAAWATHPQIDVVKANFGFTMLKGPGFIRDVKVWEAKPKADWESVKAALAP